MLKLNKDVLFLVIEELQNDGKSLHSCLLVDRTWCEITIPLLWKNPWKFPFDSILLFNVIFSHLSEESRENLKQKFDLFTVAHQQPLFNYISFCRYLNLYILGRMILEKVVTDENVFNESKISIIRNEIMRLFINRNTKFTHLYLNSYPYFQIHHFPGAEHCFSELIFLQCDIDDKNKNDLERLASMSKSIETFKIDKMISESQYSGIIRLIQAQKNLNNVKCIYKISEAFHKALEESLIKHADTVKYLQISLGPTTKVLSCLVNLISLDLNLDYTSESHDLNWSHLENAYLPVLKILKASWVPHKSLASLIENTKGHLAEISIVCTYPRNSQRIIQSIYQNCPNLEYLRFYLIFNDSNISEFEKLLINCQCLNRLFITSYDEFDWDDLFKILTKSSPTGLFKFKFCFDPSSTPKLESLKLFFDNWRGRHPMLLQTIPTYQIERKYFDLIEKYKMEGIIKKYDNYARYIGFRSI